MNNEAASFPLTYTLPLYYTQSQKKFFLIHSRYILKIGAPSQESKKSGIAG